MPQQGDLPLGGVRGSRDPRACPRSATQRRQSRGHRDGSSRPGRGESRSSPGPSEGLVWDGADRAGIPGGGQGAGR